MQVGKYAIFFVLVLLCKQVSAADTARVNQLNSYIYQQLSTCSQISSDSLSILKTFELNQEQKNIARFNYSQKLYCNKKYKD